VGEVVEVGLEKVMRDWKVEETKRDMMIESEYVCIFNELVGREGREGAWGMWTEHDGLLGIPSCF